MCVTPIVTGPTPTVGKGRVALTAAGPIPSVGIEIVGSKRVALTATGPTPTVVSERVAPTATVVNSDR